MYGLDVIVEPRSRARHALQLVMSGIAMLAMVMMVLSAVRPVAADSAPSCSDTTLSVTLAPGATDTYHVVGTLCSVGPAAGKTIQLLLHGSTYARYYWDFPYQPEHYSYVRSATSHGYATFNLDRIGSGDSDHPDGSLVDINSNAYVVHQVVQALRAGQIASTSFAKIIVVGHSMGSLTILKYASSFPGEVNGIILTGILHDANWAFLNSTLIPALYPASLDPKFAGQFQGYDYLTTVPGVRGGPFYYLPNVDPQVLAVDEQLKQTTTVAELNTGPLLVFDPVSLQIIGPVEVVVGEFDNLACGNLVNCSDKAAVQNYEKNWYGPSACLETDVISDAGHNLNLHTNANAAYSQMLSWADRNVGSTAGAAPQPCNAP